MVATIGKVQLIRFEFKVEMLQYIIKYHLRLFYKFFILHLNVFIIMKNSLMLSADIKILGMNIENGNKAIA